MLSAARSIAFRVLFKASQASDVGSIPIARSGFLIFRSLGFGPELLGKLVADLIWHAAIGCV
jgi:hypothetical protein